MDREQTYRQFEQALQKQFEESLLSEGGPGNVLLKQLLPVVQRAREEGMGEEAIADCLLDVAVVSEVLRIVGRDSVDELEGRLVTVLAKWPIRVKDALGAAIASGASFTVSGQP